MQTRLILLLRQRNIRSRGNNLRGILFMNIIHDSTITQTNTSQTTILQLKPEPYTSNLLKLQLRIPIKQHPQRLTVIRRLLIDPVPIIIKNPTITITIQSKGFMILGGRIRHLSIIVNLISNHILLNIINISS